MALLLLLSGSPFICSMYAAELLLSFPLNDLSVCVEIPIQAQPFPPCKRHASCMLSCPLLPPHTPCFHLQLLQARSGMSDSQQRGWHTAVPTAVWDKAYGGSGA